MGTMLGDVPCDAYACLLPELGVQRLIGWSTACREESRRRPRHRSSCPVIGSDRSKLGLVERVPAPGGVSSPDAPFAMQVRS